MPPIILDKFGGVYPEIPAHLLPANAAADARNCDVRWGRLGSLPTLPSAQDLGRELLATELFKLGVTGKPTLATTNYTDLIAEPAYGSGGSSNLGITLEMFIAVSAFYTDTVNNTFSSWAVRLTGGPSVGSALVSSSMTGPGGVTTGTLAGYAHPGTFTPTLTWESPNTIRLRYTMGSLAFALGATGAGNPVLLGVGLSNETPNYYKIVGPCFRIKIYKRTDDGHPYGTAATYYTLGGDGPASPGILGGVVPVMRDGKTVAFISCADIQAGSLTTGDVELSTALSTYDHFIPPMEGEIVLRVEYPHDPERVVFYAASALCPDPAIGAGDTSTYLEGPLSDVGAEEVVVPEGQRPNLTVTALVSDGDTVGETSYAATHIRLYRAFGAAVGWKRVEDIAKASLVGASWTDDIVFPPGEEAPFAGNAPYSDKETFRTAAFVHPAQFAVAVSGNKLLFSDLYAFHVWPEEFYLEFPGTNLVAVVVGSGIAVFVLNEVGACTEVHWVAGSHPGRMEATLLTTADPLARTSAYTTGMCKDAEALYYPSANGICRITAGGQHSVVTESMLSATAFAALTPASMILRQAEGMIWFGTATSGRVLIPQYPDGGFALMPYHYPTATYAPYWKSREWQFDAAENFGSLHYLGSSTVNVDVITSAGTTELSAIADKSVSPIGISTGVKTLQVWIKKAVGIGVERIGIYPQERIKVPKSGLHLNGILGMAARNMILEFEESGRFLVARVVADRADPNVPVTLTLQSVAHTITSSEDVLLTSIPTPRREWTLDISGATAIHGLTMFPDTMYEVRRGLVRIQRPEEGPATWLARQVYSPVPIQFSAARVLARVYTGLTFTLYRDEESVFTHTVTGSGAFRLPRLTPCNYWRVDITGAGESAVLGEVGTEIIEEVRIGTSMGALQ